MNTQPSPEQGARELARELQSPKLPIGTSVHHPDMMKWNAAMDKLTAIIAENRELAKEVRQNQLEDEKFLKLTQERDAAIREVERLNRELVSLDAAFGNAKWDRDLARGERDSLLKSTELCYGRCMIHSQPYIPADSRKFIEDTLLAAINAAKSKP